MKVNCPFRYFLQQLCCWKFDQAGLLKLLYRSRRWWIYIFLKKEDALYFKVHVTRWFPSSFRYCAIHSTTEENLSTTACSINVVQICPLFAKVSFWFPKIFISNEEVKQWLASAWHRRPLSERPFIQSIDLACAYTNASLKTSKVFEILFTAQIIGALSRIQFRFSHVNSEFFLLYLYADKFVVSPCAFSKLQRNLEIFSSLNHLSGPFKKHMFS